MNTDFIKGVVVPILTPIDGEERIDEARLRDQVDYVIKGGVSGILAFGSNGEFYMVEEDEMERGLKIMVDQAAGRVPVYFGIGAIRTQKCCRLAKMAVANGAAGVSVLQPMFLKPTYDELFQHFKAIAESVPGTPMLLYTGLTGFVDVAAAGAGIWAFVIYTDQERPQSARGILTGALLTLVFLLRRYFFFFTVSFGLASLAALAVCEAVGVPEQYALAGLMTARVPRNAWAICPVYSCFMIGSSLVMMGAPEGGAGRSSRAWMAA